STTFWRRWISWGLATKGVAKFMSTIQETIAWALRHYADGNLISAEESCWSALSEQPAHPEAFHVLAKIAHRRGELPQALDYLTGSPLCDRARAGVWMTLGDVHLSGGDCRAAATAYQEALRLEPDCADGFNRLGIALARLGDWQRASHSFQE